jgi:2-succinyl-5-enolpyruvyl-6-hydroxy-3-cyclohexene-1-carboxylate synthase
MHSDKISAIHLIEILIKNKVKDFIISPGSRNAPLINELVHRNNINLYSIPDERSAGFYALGMSLKTKRPSVVVCTSGSALLNYLPAVSEAFYQNIPLIVISADRPFFRIDKGEGQTIRQLGALSNFIRGEFNIPLDEKITNYEKLDNGISVAVQLSQNPVPGPVHINIEFDEPLYNNLEHYEIADVKYNIKGTLSENMMQLDKVYVEMFNNTGKVMILCGQMDRNRDLENLLQQFSLLDNVVVLTESTANINGENIIPSVDKTILTFGENNLDFAPNLLISLGDAIISKIVKRHLRNGKPIYHWQVHPFGVFRDTYDVLSHEITAKPEVFLNELLENITTVESKYNATWQKQYDIAKKVHEKYLKNAPFSDLKVFEFILNNIPKKASVHIANSSPIRYQQLFEPVNKLETLSNRGTSGIDGCLSTAAGFAIKNDAETWLITGDVSFLYDSNARWNDYRRDLKVILINNGGGGRFRILPGPKTIPEFETYFETKHQVNIKKLCSAFDLMYFYAEDSKSMVLNFKKLKKSSGISVLEIKTPGTLNAEILTDYFKALNKK